jgi:GntR family transcriptional regulator
MDLTAPLNIQLVEGPGHLPIHSQVKHALAYAIGSGQLAPGDQVPSVRELATQLGLAANTVARAYQELQDDGLLVTRTGRGTFVNSLIDTQLPARNGPATLQTILRPAVASARAVGYAAGEIRAAVETLLADETVTVGLVALNEGVVRKWTGLLHDEFDDLGIEVVAFTIADLRDNRAAALARLEGVTHVFTMVTTYAEVRSLLQPYGKKVSALITELSMATHQELATLPVDRLIGLVCHDVYENSMLGVISPYVPLHYVRRVAPEDEAGLRALLAETEIVLHTPSPAQQVRSLARPETRLIELQFLPNRACFDQIRLLLQQEK